MHPVASVRHVIGQRGRPILFHSNTLILFDQYPLADIAASQSSSTSDFVKGNIPRVCDVKYHGRVVAMLCPNVSSAAILLTFLLKDAAALDLPVHLPNRAAVRITQYDGRTVEDFVPVVQPRTPTVADSNHEFPAIHVGDDFQRSQMHHDDFSRIVLNSSDSFFVKSFANSPAVLAGLWEGQYMVWQASPCSFHH